jgi:hypothetical protein
MANTYASGKVLVLTSKLDTTGTTLFGNINVGVNKGRLYFQNNLQEEWIEFSGVVASGTSFAYTITKRGVSQTADPATAGTGLTWISGSIGELVAMHDQLADRQDDNIFYGDINFGNTAKTGLIVENLTTAQRDALGVPANGAHIYNTSLGNHQFGQGGTWVTPGNTGSVVNATETAVGIVEIATTAEIAARTTTGGSEGRVVIPADAQEYIGQQTFNLSQQMATGEIATLTDSAGETRIRRACDGNISDSFFLHNAVQYMGVTPFSPSTCNIGDGKVLVAYFNGSTVEVRAISYNGDVGITGALVSTATASTTASTPKLIPIATDTAVMLYNDNATSTNVRLITVSGTTVTLGSGFVVQAVNGTPIGGVLISANKFAVAYLGGGVVRTAVCTISGTTITAGTPVTVVASSVLGSICLCAPDKYIVATDSADSKTYVITVTGTVPAIGTGQIYDATGTQVSLLYLNPNRGVAFFQDATNRVARVFTESGTVLTFGTKTTVLAGTGVRMPACLFADGQEFGTVLASNILPFQFTVTGTTITLALSGVYTPIGTFGLFELSRVRNGTFINTYQPAGTSVVYFASFGYTVPPNRALGILQSWGATGEARAIALNGSTSFAMSGLTRGAPYVLGMFGAMSTWTNVRGFRNLGMATGTDRIRLDIQNASSNVTNNTGAAIPATAVYDLVNAGGLPATIIIIGGVISALSIFQAGSFAAIQITNAVTIPSQGILRVTHTTAPSYIIAQ